MTTNAIQISRDTDMDEIFDTEHVLIIHKSYLVQFRHEDDTKEIVLRMDPQNSVIKAIEKMKEHLILIVRRYP